MKYSKLLIPLVILLHNLSLKMFRCHQFKLSNKPEGEGFLSKCSDDEISESSGKLMKHHLIHSENIIV